jgi:hypothetical protein
MVEGCKDSSVFSQCVFYLKCDKRRESSSDQIYIEFCYSYVLVLLFFYKVKNIIYSLFWSRKCILAQDANCH